MYMIAEVSQYVAVASFSEAWIEIMSFNIITNIFRVASFSEAWIEITVGGGLTKGLTSPPSRRRGLK